jgi:hypothetical protein
VVQESISKKHVSSLPSGHLDAADFAEWAYAVFNKDDKYRKHLERLITPSKSDKGKSQFSSVVGEFVGKMVGVGWQSVLSASIFLKEHPIHLVNIKDHRDAGKQKVCFFFPTIGAAENDVKKMGIKPIKRGIVNRKAAGLRLDFECVGKRNIENDVELMDQLLQLFQTQDLCDISNWTTWPITVEVAVKNGFVFGKIEAGISKLNEDGLKTLFECATKISTHINLALESNR